MQRPTRAGEHCIWGPLRISGRPPPPRDPEVQIPSPKSSRYPITRTGRDVRARPCEEVPGRRGPDLRHCPSVGEERGGASWCPHLWAAQDRVGQTRDPCPLESGNLKGASRQSLGRLLVLPHPGPALRPRPRPLPSASGRKPPPPPSALSPTPSVPSQSLSLGGSGKPLSALSLPLPPFRLLRPVPRPTPGPAQAPPPAPAPPPRFPLRPRASQPRYSLPQAPPLGPRKPLPAPNPAPPKFLGPPAALGTERREPPPERVCMEVAEPARRGE